MSTARKHKNYTEDEVLRILSKKTTLKVIRERSTISVNVSGPSYKGDVGNGTKGKLDFLSNYCRWIVIWQ